MWRLHRVGSRCAVLSWKGRNEISVQSIIVVNVALAQDPNGGQSHSYGETLTTDIQDISAVAALFGTDMCERHVLGSLTTGSLYTAASGISMFGSLGIAKVGIITIAKDSWLDSFGVENRGQIGNPIADGGGGARLVDQLR